MIATNAPASPFGGQARAGQPGFFPGAASLCLRLDTNTGLGVFSEPEPSFVLQQTKRVLIKLSSAGRKIDVADVLAAAGRRQNASPLKLAPSTRSDRRLSLM